LNFLFLILLIRAILKIQVQTKTKSYLYYMRKILLSLALMLVAVYCFAQDRQAILKVMHTQEEAWNRGDIESFMTTYWKSDSLVFVGKTAPAYGWQTTLEHYKQTYPDKAAMGQLSFEIIQLKVLDATNAFVLGGWKLTREKDTPGGYFTLWFRKIKGEWKIVCDHTS
jgi:ketosteroid isomerase-like protein